MVATLNYTVVAMTTKDQAIEHLSDEIAKLVRRARKLGADRARLIDPSLSGTSYRLLAFLCDNGPHRAQQLVELFDLDKGAVSRYVQQLAELGLVSKHPDSSDKRATLVESTALARRRVGNVRARGFDEMGIMLDAWPMEKVEKLAARLADYNRLFENSQT